MQQTIQETKQSKKQELRADEFICPLRNAAVDREHCESMREDDGCSQIKQGCKAYWNYKEKKK